MSEPASYKYPRVMRVCQNCEYADNKKGKFFQDGWNIWCNNETRWFRWDKRKRCYTKPTNKEA